MATDKPTKPLDSALRAFVTDPEKVKAFRRRRRDLCYEVHEIRGGPEWTTSCAECLWAALLADREAQLAAMTAQNALMESTRCRGEWPCEAATAMASMELQLNNAEDKLRAMGAFRDRARGVRTSQVEVTWLVRQLDAILTALAPGRH
jgi:hypothetical protein